MEITLATEYRRAATLRAAVFAARIHAGHRRKGAAAEPYVNHVLEVAEILATHGAPHRGHRRRRCCTTRWRTATRTPSPAPSSTIEAAFGAEVAGIVAEVSDDKSLPKEVRKGLQCAMRPKASDAAKQLKLADKISNLRAIAASPPKPAGTMRGGWNMSAGPAASPPARKGANPALDALFDATYRDAVVQRAAEDSTRDAGRAGGLPRGREEGGYSPRVRDRRPVGFLMAHSGRALHACADAAGDQRRNHCVTSEHSVARPDPSVQPECGPAWCGRDPWGKSHA